MRSTHAFLLGVLVASSAACLRRTEFQCTTSAECGAAGTCQASGYCSVTDLDCSSEQRYVDSAGEYGGQCVSGGAAVDAGTTQDSAPSDAPSSACPGYDAITGGQAGHLYRLVTTTANWSNQRDGCVASTTSAHLAIPDDETELVALVDLATSTRFWVGISDQGTEGTWRTSLGVEQTFLPWEPGTPNMSGFNSDDCVFVRDNGQGEDPTIGDDRCSVQLPAICECVP